MAADELRTAYEERFPVPESVKMPLLESLKNFFISCRMWLASLHVLMWWISPGRTIIEQDVTRWVELGSKRFDIRPYPVWKQLAWLVCKIPTFRNLLYYRVRQERHWPSSLILEVAKRLYRKWPDLWIATPSIGPGLYIQHGFSTAIGAKSIGSNCWINQQVTIGYAKDDEDGPVIGNNVRIAVGAKVVGNITIGDNCIVAPNSFVYKSIPPGRTVMGVPARIVRRGGKKIGTRNTRQNETDSRRKHPPLSGARR